MGAYVALLEFAAETEATIVGKPNPSYFERALADLGRTPSEVAMIGDDPESDIGGAHAVGLKTVLVQTGKYRGGPLAIQPDWILDSIADLPAWLER